MGNKSDVEHQPAEQAQGLAEKYGVRFEECSAKEGTGVVDIFNKLARTLAEKYGSVAVD